MLKKMMENDPLAVLLVCASVVGTGFVMNYRLDSIETTQQAMTNDVKYLKKEVGALKVQVAEIKAVSDYKERLAKS